MLQNLKSTCKIIGNDLSFGTEHYIFVTHSDALKLNGN
jgi:hypothetical protein